MLLSVLYLAEGAKHKTSRFLSFGNSDHKVIEFYLKLLRNCFSLSENKFRIRIQCRADQNKKELERYWHKIVKISYAQFYPTYADKRTIGIKTKKREYMGVCAVYYFDTSIQLELEILANSVIEYLLKGR